MPEIPTTMSPVAERALSGHQPHEVSVVIVAHGNRGGPNSKVVPDLNSESGFRAPTGGIRNHALETHCTHLAKTQAFRTVTAGVLKGSPSFEDAVTEANAAEPKAIAIYPFFMADGYFVNTIIPQRLAAVGLQTPHQILSPIGLVPSLVDIIVAQALTYAVDARIDPIQARLLLVGHGSKLGPASANATRTAAQRIGHHHHAAFGEVAVAFLEEAPFLPDQLAHTQRPTIVSGFFNGDGLHAGEDVPTALAAAADSGGGPAVYTGPIGAAPEVSELIKAEIHAALVRHQEN